MNQMISIALGGAIGALLRFFVSSGVYQWLGRELPYGTLAVNVIGSFLIGLMSEALLTQAGGSLTISYRAAVLVGLFGSFTTFSTFSLETVYLIEQGYLLRAAINVLVSIGICLPAAWAGLLSGRTLFFYSGGTIRWLGWVFPYGIVAVNFLGAFLLGIFVQLLVYRVSMSMEYRAAILVVLVGMFATFSGLYLIFYLLEEGYAFNQDLPRLLAVFFGNGFVCIVAVWIGLLAAKQL